MADKTAYTPPGFPYTEADLMRLSGRTDVSRQDLYILRKGYTRKGMTRKKGLRTYQYGPRLIEGKDWIKVGQTLFYSERVLKALEK